MAARPLISRAGLFFAALVVFCFISRPVRAQLSPGNSCSNAGWVSLSNVNPAYLLACNGSTWGLGLTITSGGLVGIGTATPNSGSILDLSGSVTSMLLPSGTSAQRPSAANGMIRYNSTVPQVEGYYNGQWNALAGIAAGTPCTSSVTYSASSNGSTQLVALSSGKTISVCGYTFVAAGTVSVQLNGGTGSNCGSGTANLTPAYQMTAGTVIVDGSTITRGLQTSSSAALCINTNAAVAVQALIYYVQQ